jgi:hypothetical protein
MEIPAVPLLQELVGPLQFVPRRYNVATSILYSLSIRTASKNRIS